MTKNIKNLPLRWSSKAQGDVLNIIEFLNNDSTTASSKLLKAIDKKVLNLADHPKMSCAGRVTGTREAVLKNWRYVIVYKELPTELLVLRVLHTSKMRP